MHKNSVENLSLLEIISYRAQYQPDKQAYIFLQNGETESESITYRELERQAKAMASYLQSWQGEKALLLYTSGLEFIRAFFGCLYAGVIAVPVYPPRRNQKLSRLLAIANDAQTKLALTSTSILVDIEKRWLEKTELSQLKWVATDTIEANTQEFVPQSLTPDSLAFLQYTSGSTGIPKGVMVTHGNIIHNQQIIQTAFGNSEKSICVSWLPLFHDMGLIGHVIQPIYVGFTNILMSPTAFLQKPIRWLKAISQYRATTSGGPNFAYDLCVQKIKPEDLANLDLSSWDLAYSGAEPVRAETMEQFFQKFAPCGFNYNAFYPCYGMAETTLLVTGGDKNEKPVIRRMKAAELAQNSVVESEISGSESLAIVGCGCPYIDTKVSIVNPESLTRCGLGQVGEIWVSSGSVAFGYWNHPEATQETFQAYLKDTGEGPFLRTGDLGFVRNGELFVTGRLKDLIIIRGQNHYPQDIELTVENSHPSLRNHSSAAFSIEIKGEEQLVIACEVERTALRKFNTEEVVKEVRKAVSKKYDLQVYAVVLLKTATIPKTSSGKIQRHACRSGFLNESLNVVGEWKINLKEVDLASLSTSVEIQLDQVENAIKQQLVSAQAESKENLPKQKLVPTEEEIEAWLVSHLSRYLNVLPDEIDVNKSFSDYGLDSFIAISTTGDLAEWLGYEVEPTLFWEYPNIKNMALYLVKQSQLNASGYKINTKNKTEYLSAENFNNSPPPRKLIARLLVWIFGVVSRLVWNIEFIGLENISQNLPFILCSNHESHFDSLWITSCLSPSLKYQLCTLAKKEHFENPFKRFFASLLGGIPVDRQGNSLLALCTATQVLIEKRPVFIHPEGTRSRNGKMSPFHHGAAQLAIATGSPIIPIKIIGAYQIFPPHQKFPSLFNWQLLKRRKLKIIFGSPIEVENYQSGRKAETLLLLTEKLYQNIIALG